MVLEDFDRDARLEAERAIEALFAGQKSSSCSGISPSQLMRLPHIISGMETKVQSTRQEVVNLVKQHMEGGTGVRNNLLERVRTEVQSLEGTMGEMFSSAALAEQAVPSVLHQPLELLFTANKNIESTLRVYSQVVSIPQTCQEVKGHIEHKRYLAAYEALSGLVALQDQLRTELKSKHDIDLDLALSDLREKERERERERERVSAIRSGGEWDGAERERDVMGTPRRTDAEEETEREREAEGERPPAIEGERVRPNVVSGPLLSLLSFFEPIEPLRARLHHILCIELPRQWIQMAQDDDTEPLRESVAVYKAQKAWIGGKDGGDRERGRGERAWIDEAWDELERYVLTDLGLSVISEVSSLSLSL
ncbi:hypothetical protein KIPB_004451, partial [Kipferlia bialata]